MTKSAARQALCVGLLVSSLVACSSHSSPSQQSHSATAAPGETSGPVNDSAEQSPIPNPCDLVTTSEVEQIFGFTVRTDEPPKSTSPDGDPNGRLCEWWSPSSVQPYSAVQVALFSPDYKQCEVLSQPGITAGPNITIDPVPELDSFAYWSHSESGFQKLCTIHGGREVSVSANTTPTATRESLLSLMKKVLTQI